MLLELLRPVSFLLGLLSLYPVLLSAFFEPGTHWQERLEMALLRVVLSACLCLASGMLFARHPEFGEAPQPVLKTLPMRIFLWALAGMIVLFVVSWYLNEYYVPMASRDCCRI
jgi:hypothetical protein